MITSFYPTQLTPMQKLGVVAVTLRYDARMNRALMKRFHEAGMAVWGSNTNDPKEMANLINAEVDGIITDSPERLLELLRK